MPSGWVVQYAVRTCRRYCLVAIDDPKDAIAAVTKTIGSANIQLKSRISDDHRTLAKMSTGQVLLLGTSKVKRRSSLPIAKHAE